jgi:hypothetical protein
MKQHQTKVLVFKSNLVADEDVLSLKPLMDNHPDVLRWNVDLHDCDNVLRIETNNLTPMEIENLLVNAGFFCEELPD